MSGHPPLTTGRTDQIQQLVAESEAKATEFSSMANKIITNSPDAVFVKIVEDSLRNFSDYIFLGQSALPDWIGLETIYRLSAIDPQSALMYPVMIFSFPSVPATPPPPGCEPGVSAKYWSCNVSLSFPIKTASRRSPCC